MLTVGWKKLWTSGSGFDQTFNCHQFLQILFTLFTHAKCPIVIDECTLYFIICPFESIILKTNVDE